MQAAMDRLERFIARRRRLVLGVWLVLLLGALPRHMGFVLIEHDLEIALKAVERVTVMHDGRVLKHGTPEEIENDPEVQAIYMGTRH